MTVRVGIVSWNTAELLNDCLRRLPDALEGVDHEVVVVDNASSDDSVAAARRHDFVRVIANDTNVGYAMAMNQALTGSDADILIALNPDTAPPPGSLAELVRLIRAQPGSGMVVPRLLNPDGSLQHSVYRYPTGVVAAVVSFVPRRMHRGRIGRQWWLEGTAPHDEATSIDWAIGAVHVIRADALEGMPPYSDEWFMYVEDLELCWRLNQAGWDVRLEPSVEIPHVGNASGQQAWGDRRSLRYWACTYDFVRTRRGRIAGIRLALANTIGLGWVLLKRVAGGLAHGKGLRGRGLGPQLAVLGLHLRMIFKPSQPPPGDPVSNGTATSDPP